MSERGMQHSSEPNAAEIHARAVEWLLEKRDSENWSEDDQASLDAWLAQSPAHLLAYWRAEDGWKRTEFLSTVRPLGREVSARKRVGPVWLRAAAAAILLAAGAAGFWRYASAREHVYSTPIGGYEAIALSDGSRIELNTNTSLRTSMEGNRRIVTLDKGEAFFKVRHDPAHPFIVVVGDHRITDLGTKFTVRRNSNGLEVSLLEGRVRLGDVEDGAASRQTLLTPGERAVATSNSVSITKAPVRQLMTELSWRRGVLVFHRTTLAEAAAELNRYNHTKIVVGDSGAAQMTMTGAFPANDIAAFVVTAREVFGLTVDNRGDEIVITRPAGAK